MIRTLEWINPECCCGLAKNEIPQLRDRIYNGLLSAWRRKFLFASANLFVLSCISSAPLASQVMAPPPPERPELLAPYLAPQRLVKITNDRAINLVCLGEGSPTVVLTAGLGGWSQVWYLVQGTVSHTTRVCAWDPAGLGFSSPSPETQDADHETEDLEKTLKGAQINGPFVMVGHSAGAFVTVLFADKHPNEVVGMVLLDPAIPDEAAIRERIAPKWGAAGTSGPALAAQHLQQCAAQLRNGALKRGTPEFDQCTVQPMPDVFSSLSARLAHLNTDPARLLTQASALINVNLWSPREAINPHRSYGNMPIIVLSAGHSLPPDMPPDVREQVERYFQALVSGHKAYAALSTRGRFQSVPNSGHFVQFDDPAAVIAAIKSVLGDIRIPPSQ